MTRAQVTKKLLRKYGETDDLNKCVWILPNGKMLSGMRPKEQHVRESHIHFADECGFDGDVDGFWRFLGGIKLRIITTDRVGMGVTEYVELPEDPTEAQLATLERYLPLDNIRVRYWTHNSAHFHHLDLKLFRSFVARSRNNLDTSIMLQRSDRGNNSDTVTE